MDLQSSHQLPSTGAGRASDATYKQSSVSPGVPSGHTRLILAGILLLAFILRLPGFQESLWYDELWSTHIKVGSLATLMRTISADLHPPFYEWIMFVWIKVFGDSEVSVRTPPLIFGLLSILLSFAIARRVIGERAALIAAFLLAVSPPHIWYSQEARQYTSILFFLLTAVYAWCRIEDGERSRTWWLIYAVALFACVFTHFYVAVYLALLPGLSFLKRSPAGWKLLLVSCLLGLGIAVFIGVKVLNGGVPPGGHLSSFTPYKFWLLLFDWFPTGGNTIRSPWALAFVQLCFFAFFVQGIRVLIRLPRRWT